MFQRNKEPLYILMFLISLFPHEGLCLDPCVEAVVFPDVYLGSRNEHCKAPTSQISQQCDYYLKDGWYSFPNASIITQCPLTGDCGVVYPVWMNGTFPRVDEGTVNRTACVRKGVYCCEDELDILVKNCSTHHVYYLKKTLECSSVYCLESTLPCVEPTTTTLSTSTVTTTTVTTSSTTEKSTERQTTKDSDDSNKVLLIAVSVSGGILLCIAVGITIIVVNKYGHVGRVRQDTTSKGTKVIEIHHVNEKAGVCGHVIPDGPPPVYTAHYDVPQ